MIRAHIIRVHAHMQARVDKQQNTCVSSLFQYNRCQQIKLQIANYKRQPSLINGS